MDISACHLSSQAIPVSPTGRTASAPDWDLSLDLNSVQAYLLGGGTVNSPARHDLANAQRLMKEGHVVTRESVWSDLMTATDGDRADAKVLRNDLFAALSSKDDHGDSYEDSRKGACWIDAYNMQPSEAVIGAHSLDGVYVHPTNGRHGRFEGRWFIKFYVEPDGNGQEQVFLIGMHPSVGLSRVGRGS